MKGVPPGKRFLDLILSFLGILILTPLMGFISLLILVFQGQPILFRQDRPGYKGRLFTLYKFRTMTESYSAEGTRLPDSTRMTRLGRLLRQTSLDELPSLFNILRGDLSLVGPRPLLPQYLPLYTPEQARRLDVIPGVTGWAQINGRNVLSWEEKFQLDVWYVDHQSFWLDLKILMITVWKVLTREGISQPGMETAEEFTGSKQE